MASRAAPRKQVRCKSRSDVGHEETHSENSASSCHGEGLADSVKLRCVKVKRQNWNWTESSTVLSHCCPLAFQNSLSVRAASLGRNCCPIQQELMLGIATPFLMLR
jgi:hypothetical protein